MNVFKCTVEGCSDLPFYFVKSDGAEHFDTGFCSQHYRGWSTEHRIRVQAVLDEIG